jgi:hypothetical protein
VPSWEIHEKYAKLMGVSVEVAREVDKLIDNLRDHDFYDLFLEKSSKPRDLETISYINYLKTMGVGKLLGIRIRVRSYVFKSSLFRTSQFYEKLKTYGEDGLRAFFLHMFLDLIERNERGKGVEILEIVDDDYYFVKYLWEVESFIKSNFNLILADIWKDIEKRRRRRDRETIRKIDRIIRDLKHLKRDISRTRPDG